MTAWPSQRRAEIRLLHGCCIRAALLAGAEQLLRIALIVTLTPTDSGADMGGNDVITAVKSEDLYGARVQ